MHQSPSMSFLIHESADEYHAKAKHYLSSHQLADFRKCPQLYYRKKYQPRTQEESPAYLVGRAGIDRIDLAFLKSLFESQSDLSHRVCDSVVGIRVHWATSALALAATNRPRSVFTNREVSPLASSRRIAL